MGLSVIDEKLRIGSSTSCTRSLRDIFENELKDIYRLNGMNKTKYSGSCIDDLSETRNEMVNRAEKLFCLLSVAQPINENNNYEILSHKIGQQIQKIKKDLEVVNGQLLYSQN